jgi:hypothetical protein
LDIKGGVEASPKIDELEVRISLTIITTTLIDMSNTRIDDVRLLSSGRSEPVKNPYIYCIIIILLISRSAIV